MINAIKPTLRRCPQCGVDKRLVSFRRFAQIGAGAGMKRVLHDTCNDCEPEPNLSEMTPAQRERAVEADNPKARALVVEVMNDKERAELAGMRTRQRIQYHAKQRRAAWREAIGRQISDELEWARRGLASARRAEDSAWADFFEAYCQVLRAAQERVATEANKRFTRVKPTPEQARPEAWIDASTRASLRRLYAQCRPISGRRMYRDPWCLEWE